MHTCMTLSIDGVPNDSVNLAVFGKTYLPLPGFLSGSVRGRVIDLSWQRILANVNSLLAIVRAGAVVDKDDSNQRSIKNRISSCGVPPKRPEKSSRGNHAFLIIE